MHLFYGMVSHPMTHKAQFLVLYFSTYILMIFSTLSATTSQTMKVVTPNAEIDTLRNTLENDANILTTWFEINFLKMNPDKCHLLTTKHGNETSIKIGGKVILGSKSVKPLGVTSHSHLDFSNHVSNLCKMVSLKVHVLARISEFMSAEKLRAVVKAFIESQFGYCALDVPWQNIE